MKKHWFYGGAVCLVALAVLWGIWSYSKGQEASTQKKTSMRIGVLLYRGMTHLSAPCVRPWKSRQRNTNRGPGSR